MLGQVTRHHHVVEISRLYGVPSSTHETDVSCAIARDVRLRLAGARRQLRGTGMYSVNLVRRYERRTGSGPTADGAEDVRVWRRSSIRSGLSCSWEFLRLNHVGNSE